eukprot:GEMP01049388.1.p1 GENE.GEMP01049388.1~~GEMP01049388.1.p1  ORF type:complete len:304 (+),score=71.29 GEMP01049388.1:159-1070(+)
MAEVLLNGREMPESRHKERKTQALLYEERRKMISRITAKLRITSAFARFIGQKGGKTEQDSSNESKRTLLLRDVLQSHHTARLMSERRQHQHKRGSKGHGLHERFMWRRALSELPPEKEEEKPDDAPKPDDQLARRRQADDEDAIMRIARELNMEDDALKRTNKRCTTLRNQLKVANEDLGDLSAMRPWSRNPRIDVVSNTEKVRAEVQVRLEHRAIGKFVIGNMHYEELDAISQSIIKSRSHDDLRTQCSFPRTTDRLLEDQRPLPLHPVMTQLDNTVLEPPDALSRLLQEFPLGEIGVQGS